MCRHNETDLSAGWFRELGEGSRLAFWSSRYGKNRFQGQHCFSVNFRLYNLASHPCSAKNFLSNKRNGAIENHPCKHLVEVQKHFRRGNVLSQYQNECKVKVKIFHLRLGTQKNCKLVQYKSDYQITLNKNLKYLLSTTNHNESVKKKYAKMVNLTL